jgi:hypothetical protein
MLAPVDLDDLAARGNHATTPRGQPSKSDRSPEAVTLAIDVFANNSVMPNGLTVSAWEARVRGSWTTIRTSRPRRITGKRAKRLSWLRIPIESDHLFRSNPIADCGVSDHLAGVGVS